MLLFSFYRKELDAKRLGSQKVYRTSLLKRSHFWFWSSLTWVAIPFFFPFRYNLSLYKWMFLRFILHYSISRMVKDLRCIIFVERIISAIVLHSLLSQVSKLSCWKSKYMAGNRLGLHSQTRKDQMDIVDSFRGGKVGFLFYFLI